MLFEAAPELLVVLVISVIVGVYEWMHNAKRPVAETVHHELCENKDRDLIQANAKILQREAKIKEMEYDAQRKEKCARESSANKDRDLIQANAKILQREAKIKEMEYDVQRKEKCARELCENKDRDLIQANAKILQCEAKIKEMGYDAQRKEKCARESSANKDRDLIQANAKILQREAKIKEMGYMLMDVQRKNISSNREISNLTAANRKLSEDKDRILNKIKAMTELELAKIKEKEIEYMRIYSQHKEISLKRNESLKRTETNHLESVNCVICQTDRRTIIFSPCRHMCCCETCASSPGLHDKCPLCRADITSKEKIFW
jgi:hypothetical protein